MCLCSSGPRRQDDRKDDHDYGETVDYHRAGNPSGSCGRRRRSRARPWQNAGSSRSATPTPRPCGGSCASNPGATPICTEAFSCRRTATTHIWGAFCSGTRTGFSTNCGHGTIALGAWAIHTGLSVALLAFDQHPLATPSRHPAAPSARSRAHRPGVPVTSAPTTDPGQGSLVRSAARSACLRFAGGRVAAGWVSRVRQRGGGQPVDVRPLRVAGGSAASVMLLVRYLARLPIRRSASGRRRAGLGCRLDR